MGKGPLYKGSRAGVKVRAMTGRPGWTPGALRLAALRQHPDRLRVENATGTSDDTDTATMWVYDEISWCGVSAEAFAKELDGITASTITLRLNSPGGDLFYGIAIHNSLRNHPATVNVIVDGLAASAASVIAMAGDTIAMGAGTQMMIHDGMAMCIGNAYDMQETANLLNKCSEEIAGFYARRGGGSTDDWRALMRAETWYTGPEAVAANLADTFTPSEPESDTEPGGAAPDVAPTARFDLSIFNYSGRQQAPAPRPVQPPPTSIPIAIPANAVRHAVQAGLRPSAKATPDYGSMILPAMRKAH